MTNKISVILVFSSLLIASDVGVSIRLDPNSKSNNTIASLRTHEIVESSCGTTLYPAICYSTLSNVSDITQKITNKKDVIELAINKTKETILDNFHTVRKLTHIDNLSTRDKIALQVCLEMVDETLEGLDTVMHNLRAYPTKKSIVEDADDLKTLMSTTITNMETCKDELSHNAALLKVIMEDQNHGGKMCSNVLAMVTNLTDTEIAKSKKKLKLEDMAMERPEWLPRRERKLLFGLWGNKPNAFVSKDGKGNHTTVADAVEKAPAKSTKRYIIKIAKGVYKENIEIPKNKPYIMFIGDGRDNTIITGSKNVAAGGATTTSSATVGIVGDGFLARDLTFQNTAGPSGHQAVALRVQSDKSAFYKCCIDGYQDTLYVHSKRQFYVECLVMGTVDTIFGNAAVVFQSCDLHARKPGPKQKNMLTAQGRSDPNQNTGIVIQYCSIDGTADLKKVMKDYPTYLGRPWQKHSRTVVMKTEITEVIDPEGWAAWDKKNASTDTVTYREWRNYGPGSDTSKRVKWKGVKVIWFTIEVIPYTVGLFITGWTWLLSTGFPFWLGW